MEPKLIEALKEHPAIRCDSAVMAGAACVAGTRIPVYEIIMCGSKKSAKKNYPQLEMEDIESSFEFAAKIVDYFARLGE